MATFKTSLFAFLLVTAVAVVPMAQAQVGLINGLLSLIRIQGTVFCSATGNTAAPVFSNATVQLVCGRTLGTVVSTATTNDRGLFSIVLDPLQFLLSQILSDCKLLVPTPLTVCNPDLSGVTGVLTSALQSIENTVIGLLRIIRVIPVGFILNTN